MNPKLRGYASKRDEISSKEEILTVKRKGPTKNEPCNLLILTGRSKEEGPAKETKN